MANGLAANVDRNKRGIFGEHHGAGIGAQHFDAGAQHFDAGVQHFDAGAQHFDGGAQHFDSGAQLASGAAHLSHGSGAADLSQGYSYQQPEFHEHHAHHEHVRTVHVPYPVVQEKVVEKVVHVDRPVPQVITRIETQSIILRR